MNIEENITEFKKMIERDKDTLRYWKNDTFGHYEEPIKKLEKDVLICETLLTAYEKEKETSHYIQSQLDIANAKLIEEKGKNKELEKQLQSTYQKQYINDLEAINHSNVSFN